MSCKKQYERISGDFSRYFNRLINHKRRGVITTKELLDILEKQKGKCALSGITLTCMLEQGKKFTTNASIDQIIPGKGYDKENVQLVCAALNLWKGNTPNDEFIWFCKQVAQFHEKGVGS